MVPALAVAGALRGEGAEVAFIGGARAEARLVPVAGFPFHAIAVEGLSRSNPLRAARALARAGVAVVRARSLLSRLAPDAVLGGGGYVSGPVGLAAATLRIPLVLSEADSHLGLTNRALAPVARRVCLSFPIAGREGARYRVTGRPVPASAADRGQARERFGIGAEETCVLVFGGSLGARSINLAAIDAFAGVIDSAATGALAGATDSAATEVLAGASDSAATGALAGATDSAAAEVLAGASDSAATAARAGAKVRVVHVCGSRDYAELAARRLPRNYDLREYLDLAEFADALAAADLAVARAGGSIFEIAAHGVPAILIPYPHASADHQAANARWMAQAGAATVIADRELTGERLAAEVSRLLADRPLLAAMASASKRLARPDAARDVASELLEAAG